MHLSYFVASAAKCFHAEGPWAQAVSWEHFAAEAAQSEANAYEISESLGREQYIYTTAGEEE